MSIMQKGVVVLAVLLVIAGSIASVYTQLLARHASLHTKIASYAAWGLNTKPFEALEKKLHPWEVTKHEQIVTLAMQTYAQEVNSQMAKVGDLISYVRDRVRGSTDLTQDEQIRHLDALQDIAGAVFDHTLSLSAIKHQFILAEKEDDAVTADIEQQKKQTIFTEIEGYQTQCEANLQFFEAQQNADGQALAKTCLAATAQLLEPGYRHNGAQFLATLVRERIYGYVEQTTEKKQQIIQDEQFALLAKQQDAEKNVLVPPAPVTTGKVVVVNTNLQRLYAYQDGLPLFPSAVPVTTGKRGFETVTGTFAVYDKQRNFRMTSPFPGIYYDNVVSYWMPFYLGYGLHDAPWRTVYGTPDYVTVGSYGCVNIPLDKVAILYNWVEIGTKVIVI